MKPVCAALSRELSGMNASPAVTPTGMCTHSWETHTRHIDSRYIDLDASPAFCPLFVCDVVCSKSCIAWAVFLRSCSFQVFHKLHVFTSLDSHVPFFGNHQQHASVHAPFRTGLHRSRNSLHACHVMLKPHSLPHACEHSCVQVHVTEILPS